MSGSLLAISAVGPQDDFLTTSPQVTLFRANYRRHSIFSVETIEQTFSGSVGFGRKLTCTVSRVADLLKDVKFVADLPALAQSSGTVAWTRHIAQAMVDYVQLEIGGQKVDQLYNHYINMWAELSMDAAKDATYQKMIGNTSALTTQAASIAATRVYLPLPFWFTQDPGLALILIALQYHDVKIIVQTKPIADLYVTDDGLAPSTVGDLTNATLYCEYVFLDTAERTGLVSQPIEQLITQVQFNGAETISNPTARLKLSFNHPTTCIVWALQLADNLSSGRNRVFDYTTSGSTLNSAYTAPGPLSTANITLNGQDKFQTREAGYFNLLQPYDYAVRGPVEGIYLYSFALNAFGPKSYVQPTGSVNFSRIDTSFLNLTTNTSTSSVNVYIFAISRNALRYVSGLGGVGFSS